MRKFELPPCPLCGVVIESDLDWPESKMDAQMREHVVAMHPYSIDAFDRAVQFANAEKN